MVPRARQARQGPRARPSGAGGVPERSGSRAGRLHLCRDQGSGLPSRRQSFQDSSWDFILPLLLKGRPPSGREWAHEAGEQVQQEEGQRAARPRRGAEAQAPPAAQPPRVWGAGRGAPVP